eukprot:13964156-Alexandrium_andersonii.AAC.1
MLTHSSRAPSRDRRRRSALRSEPIPPRGVALPTARTTRPTLDGGRTRRGRGTMLRPREGAPGPIGGRGITLRTIPGTTMVRRTWMRMRSSP